jgi:hypothetical protein
MKALNCLLPFLTVIVLAVVGQQAEGDAVRVLEIDTEASWQYSTGASLGGVSLTRVSPSDFAAVNLDDYQVLWVGETFCGTQFDPSVATLSALKARAADISNWLAAGHGIFACTEPTPRDVSAENYAWVPSAIRPTLLYSPYETDTVQIVAPDHPVMAGLTNDGLSNWSDSAHTFYTDHPGLDVLTTDGAGAFVTLAGTFGTGRIVLTAQDPDFHFVFGRQDVDQVLFVQNAIDWVAGVPEPSTFAFLGIGAFGLLAYAWRRRRAR